MTTAALPRGRHRHPEDLRAARPRKVYPSPLVWRLRRAGLALLGLSVVLTCAINPSIPGYCPSVATAYALAVAVLGAAALVERHEERRLFAVGMRLVPVTDHPAR